MFKKMKKVFEQLDRMESEIKAIRSALERSGVTVEEELPKKRKKKVPYEQNRGRRAKATILSIPDWKFRSYEDIAQKTGFTYAKVSYHVAQMKKKGY